MSKKVIIDTDIGGDIDDAFALCLAMKSPELDIRGVTTVYGDTLKRARIAKALVRAAGRGDIPVYAGEGVPLGGQDIIYGRKNDFHAHPQSYSAEYDGVEVDGTDAVSFIISELEKAEEGEYTLITLGALTNIARVLDRRPDLKGRIGRISVMGGAFLINLGEFNFSCDPPAADAVLNCGLSVYCVGVDITFKCSPSEVQLGKLRQHTAPCIKMLMKLNEAWGSKIFLHDPLAVLCAFDPGLVRFEKRICRVETKGEFTSGCVSNQSDFNWQLDPKDSPLWVGVEVKGDEVVEKCMERLLSY